MTADPAAELHTIIDLIRYGASRFNASDLTFGHSYDNARLLKSDLFSGLSGEHYQLIVTNPPYVTNAETDALPKEYSYEPEMGLRAGDDGLDLVLKILRDAPLHLSQDGLLICEVGESEQALVKLLPDVEFAWVEFKVGQMGIFAVECAELIVHHSRIRQLADARP